MSSATLNIAPPRRVARRPGVKPLIERRFPLHLEPSIKTVRQLYDRAKAGRWDPERHIPWKSFCAETYTPEQLSAGAITWSRRAWIEYTGFAETPAILIRFCLEHEGESDPKMFLTVRGSEESWHVECAYRFAELLGGYIDRPANPAFADLYSLGLFRQAFDPALSPVAYIAAHVAMLDGIDLELHRGFLRTATDPVAVSILRRMVQDKERHTAFGWVYLQEHAASWTDETREEIADEVEHIVRTLVLNGYLSPALAAGDVADDILAADRVTRECGLGALTGDEEVLVVREYLREARQRLAGLGVDIGAFAHERYGEM